MEIFRSQLLAGKTAFLTGGTSGIGLAIAERMAAHGARIGLFGRNPERLESALARIRDAGGVAEGEPGDVRQYAELEGAIGRCAGRWGSIDVLVCAAAGNFPAAAAEMSANGFKAVVDIDLLGTYHACRAAFPHLTRPGAAVINISAPQAFIPMAMQSHVCAAKAGVDMLTKSLAIEWAPEGIRVNSIVPGATDDTEGMRRLAPTEEARERSRRGVPLGRLGTKEELAGLALFLATSAAGYITGAVVVADGGLSLTRSGFHLADHS